MSKTKILFAAALTLVLYASGSVTNAQGSQPPTLISGAQPTTASNTVSSNEPQQNLDELRKNALIIAENKRLKEQVAGLEQERDALKGQVTSALGLVETWKVISGEWQTAAQQRKGAIDTGVKLDINQQKSLTDAEAEIARTRALLDSCRNPGFFKSLFKTDTLLKVGAGVVLDRLVLQPKN